VLTFFMALLSFVDSTPRAYRLKASNAAPPISTSPGAIPWFTSHGIRWSCISSGPSTNTKIISVTLARRPTITGSSSSGTA
jgi:hypothetical protein